jgi:hypothetical protein
MDTHFSHDTCWQTLADLLATPAPAATRWQQLVDALRAVQNKPYWPKVAQADLDAEAQRVQQWFALTLNREPLPAEVDGLWLGISELWDDDREAAFYAVHLVGGAGFDPDDDSATWATEPLYSPGEGADFLRLDHFNPLLDLLDRDADFAVLDWILPLAYVCFVAETALHAVDLATFGRSNGQIGLCAGFDNGDFQFLQPLVF